jgi:hypothetical protein
MSKRSTTCALFLPWILRFIKQITQIRTHKNPQTKEGHMPEPARIPKTTEKVTFSLPTFLLELVDNHCFRTGDTRSSLITKALRQFLLSQYDCPAFWNEMYQKKISLSHYSLRDRRAQGVPDHTVDVHFRRPTLWERVFRGWS